eukprot:11221944-Prorocentrum_lima.AAC.1
MSTAPAPLWRRKSCGAAVCKDRSTRTRLQHGLQSQTIQWAAALSIPVQCARSSIPKSNHPPLCRRHMSPVLWMVCRGRSR